MKNVKIQVREIVAGYSNEIGSIIEGVIALDDGEEIVDIQRPNPFKKFYVITKTEV